MKKYLTLLCIAHVFILPCTGQNFVYQSNSPFGIKTMNAAGKRPAQTISFHDYDNDGDLDLFITGLDSIDNVSNLKWENFHFFIELQRNTGDAHHPQFGDRESIFEDFPYPVGYFFASPGDLNDDHTTDFITSSSIDYIGNETMSMLINSGISGPGQFEETTFRDMGLLDNVPESLFIPTLTDLDGDGDLDLMTSGFKSAYGVDDGPNVPIFYYARNAGSIHQTAFEGWYKNPYGLEPDTLGEILTSGDIDNDGDIDFIGSLINIPADSVNFLSVHINTPGPNGKPFFSIELRSPFGLPTVHGESQLLFPTLADMDGDSDLDLFVFNGNAQSAVLQYFENTLCTGPVTQVVNATICDGDVYEIGNEIFSNPGAYTIHLTTAGGCDSIVELNLVTDIVDPSVFINDHTLMAAQVGATYQWFDCDSGQPISGAVGQTYEVTTTGNYAVYVTDAFGCTVQSMCLNIIISGVKDVLADAISFYPNPTTGIVNIENKSSYPVGEIMVINLSGQVMSDIKLDGNNTVDLSSLGAGLYIIKAKINGYEVMKKVIVF
ncbi:MAG: T9SS type A sorting domain-containing protein [Saprospiraceae bacterium]